MANANLLTTEFKEIAIYQSSVISNMRKTIERQSQMIVNAKNIIKRDISENSHKDTLITKLSICVIVLLVTNIVQMVL